MSKPAGYYAAKLNAEYEHKDGKIVTRAYRDSGGVPTGPGGIITHDNGEPVRMGDKWTEDEAIAIYARRLNAYAARVDKLVGFPLNDFQRDACTVLMWNIGSAAFANSTVLEKVKERRFEEAAEAFTLWRRDRLFGGTLGPDGTPARDPNGNVMEPGYSWFKAVNGIRRRSCAAGLLFMSLDWKDATRPDRIKMEKTPVFHEAQKEWVDRVDWQTPWRDVVSWARYNHLPPPPVVEVSAPETRETVKLGKRIYVLPPDFNSWPEDTRTAWLNERMDDVLEESAPASVAASQKVDIAPPPPAAKPEPPKNAPTGPEANINPNRPGKRLEDSKRVNDVVGMRRGRDVGIIGTLGGGGIAAAAANVEKVGGVIEKLNPQTWLIIGASLVGVTIFYSIVQQWWSKNSLHHRRQREQEPVY